jgi:hypothetical protein
MLQCSNYKPGTAEKKNGLLTPLFTGLLPKA